MHGLLLLPIGFYSTTSFRRKAVSCLPALADLGLSYIGDLQVCVILFHYNRILHSYPHYGVYHTNIPVGNKNKNKTMRNAVMWGIVGKGPFKTYNFCMTHFLLNLIFTRVKVKIKNFLKRNLPTPVGSAERNFLGFIQNT